MSDYLPIGSVVKIRHTDKAIFMIAGYFPKRESSKIFDYFSVPFPVGLINDQQYFCFNKGDVVEVLHTGYCNDVCDEILNGFDHLVETFFPK